MMTSLLTANGGDVDGRGSKLQRGKSVGAHLVVLNFAVLDMDSVVAKNAVVFLLYSSICRLSGFI